MFSARTESYYDLCLKLLFLHLFRNALHVTEDIFTIPIEAKSALDKVKQSKRILYEAIAVKKRGQGFLSSIPLKQRAGEFSRAGRDNSWPSVSSN